MVSRAKNALKLGGIVKGRVGGFAEQVCKQADWTQLDKSLLLLMTSGFASVTCPSIAMYLLNISRDQQSE